MLGILTPSYLDQCSVTTKPPKDTEWGDSVAYEGDITTFALRGLSPVGSFILPATPPTPRSVRGDRIQDSRLRQRMPRGMDQNVA